MSVEGDWRERMGVASLPVLATLARRGRRGAAVAARPQVDQISFKSTSSGPPVFGGLVTSDTPS
jgi:hypothetical protein